MEEKKKYYTEARARANKKYLSELSELKIRVPKGKKEEIKNHATSMNESVNAFVCRAIELAIHSDNESK